MSITIQQILLDAKRLASRLKEHDSAADALLSQSQSVFKQIDAMKQVCNNLLCMYVCILNHIDRDRCMKLVIPYVLSSGNDRAISYIIISLSKQDHFILQIKLHNIQSGYVLLLIININIVFMYRVHTV